MLVDVGQAFAELAPALSWKRSLPRPQRYFRTGTRAVRPHDATDELIDDATRRRKRTPEQHAKSATAWRELRRRSWGMAALCARSTLPLHRHLGNDPKLDRLLSIVLGARGDGAAAAELTYEQGASELMRSRATWWRYRKQAEKEGWIGVTKSHRIHQNQAKNRTNLYYPGPRLLDALAQPDVAKALRRAAEEEVYGKQRGTAPRVIPHQEPLLPDLEPAVEDCPVGAWSLEPPPEAEKGEPVNDDQLALLTLLEEACEPADPPVAPVDHIRLAQREGWVRVDDDTWRLHVHANFDTTEVVMTADELQNFFARRRPSRIATTTPELIKFREDTDQAARVRRDRAERTAARGRGLPAPPRIDLDEDGARVLEAMLRRAEVPHGSADPELLRQTLTFGATIDAGGGPGHPAAAALAALVAQASRGSPNGARLAAFREISRCIGAMPAAPQPLVKLRESLGHVLRDYPSGTDDEDGA